MSEGQAGAEGMRVDRESLDSGEFLTCWQYSDMNDIQVFILRRFDYEKIHGIVE